MQMLLENLDAVLLLLAAAGWYVSVMLATATLTSQRDTPARRAQAAFVCNVPIVILALGLGRYEIAVGMIFATAVACMTLVLGIVTVAAGTTPASPARRGWGMLLPVALVCFLIGMRGGFGWAHALMLLLQGVAVLCMWPEAERAGQAAPRTTRRQYGLMSAAVIGATLAGAAGVLAATTLSPGMGLINAGLVTALMLTPAMVLPLIGLGLQAVHEGKYDQFVGGLTGFVYLNICLLLPIAIGLWLTQAPRRLEVFNPEPTTLPSILPATTTPATTAAATTSEADDPPLVTNHRLPYPMAIWRVDTVLLMAVGLLLMPVSMGRWSLGRMEGFCLIFTWAVFMILTVMATQAHRL